MKRTYRKQKVSKKGIIVLLLYFTMVSVGYFNNAGYASENNSNMFPNENFNPLEKIQPDLYEKVLNPDLQEEKLRLILMIKDKKVPILPDGVDIIRKYSLIDAILVQSPV